MTRHHQGVTHPVTAAIFSEFGVFDACSASYSVRSHKPVVHDPVILPDGVGDLAGRRRVHDLFENSEQHQAVGASRGTDGEQPLDGLSGYGSCRHSSVKEATDDDGGGYGCAA